MEGNGLFSGDGPRVYQMERDALIWIVSKRVRIECISGTIWITWPDAGGGRERVLKEAQSMEVVARGKICVNALTPARARVQAWEVFPFGIFNRIGVRKTIGARMDCFSLKCPCPTAAE